MMFTACINADSDLVISKEQIEHAGWKLFEIDEDGYHHHWAIYQSANPAIGTKWIFIQFVLSRTLAQSANILEKFLTQHITHHRREATKLMKTIFPIARVCEIVLAPDRNTNTRQPFAGGDEQEINPRMLAHEKFSLRSHIANVKYAGHQEGEEISGRNGAKPSVCRIAAVNKLSNCPRTNPEPENDQKFEHRREARK